MRDEVREDEERLGRDVEAARVYIGEHRRVLAAVATVLVVAEVVAVVALDGLWVKAATGVVLAQAITLFLFVSTTGDGGEL